MVSLSIVVKVTKHEEECYILIDYYYYYYYKHKIFSYIKFIKKKII